MRLGLNSGSISAPGQVAVQTPQAKQRSRCWQPGSRASSSLKRGSSSWILSVSSIVIESHFGGRGPRPLAPSPKNYFQYFTSPKGYGPRGAVLGALAAFLRGLDHPNAE